MIGDGAVDDDHECVGGWMYVSERYATHLAEETVHANTVPKQAIVAAFRNSVYPCTVCRPDLFYRWAGGHLAAGHNRSECVECSERQSGKRAPRQSAGAQSMTPDLPPPPGDAHDPDRWQQRADLA